MTNNGFDPSPTEPFMPDDLNYITESVCIITDKVYAHCQQRECFPELEQDLPEGCIFDSIRFLEGFIVEGTLTVTDLTNRPNFRRVRFTLRIPFVITCENGTVVEGFLPDILKDVILFIPAARDEFDFRIVVETSSQLLTDPLIINSSAILSVGVFIIIKVVGRVQLLIPAFGFCPEPPECEEFSPNGDICEDFDYRPFPDFFPQQYEDIYPQ